MNRRLNVAIACTVAVCLAMSQVFPLRASSGADASHSEVLRRFLVSGPPMVRSYVTHRILVATAQNGKMEATLEAIARFENGRFSYEIVRETGSAILRNYVLQRALEEERRTINEGRTGEAALSPANYRFTPGRVDAEGLARISITPHAPAAMLLDGEIHLDHTGQLVAIEGRLSQPPSFWTPSVNIERRYAQIAGYRVPDLMRSRAQVRVVGTGMFEMRYIYRQINGREVSGRRDDRPVAPIPRGPHIIPANHVRGEPLRKRS